MAGLGASERRFSADLDQPRVLCGSTQRVESLLELLRREFALLDGCPAPPAAYWTHLPVDDLIYRTLALLLFPRLAAQLEQPEVSPSLGRERVFAELLEWIHDNLHRPLGLTELEQRSGYSRRSLQLAFQQRYGCGPIQWIRQQRLEQARLALLHPQPRDSVSAIAARLGFSSLSAFSRDFRAAFGVTPSELLREGLEFSR
jgi:AraC-like DNA-binding protein